MSLIQLAEKRWLPDPLIRYGMRRMLRERLEQENENARGDYDLALDRFADRQRQSVVTIETHRANEQHYEVPAAFFELVLGARLKYSGGLWEDDSTSLDESEDAMLRTDVPACWNSGWDASARSRMWVGLADAVDCRELPKLPNHIAF